MFFIARCQNLVLHRKFYLGFVPGCWLEVYLEDWVGLDQSVLDPVYLTSVATAQG